LIASARAPGCGAPSSSGMRCALFRSRVPRVHPLSVAQFAPSPHHVPEGQSRLHKSVRPPIGGDDRRIPVRVLKTSAARSTRRWPSPNASPTSSSTSPSGPSPAATTTPSLKPSSRHSNAGRRGSTPARPGPSGQRCAPLFDYIDGFYNTERIQHRLRDQGRMDFEAHAVASTRVHQTNGGPSRRPSTLCMNGDLE